MSPAGCCIPMARLLWMSGDCTCRQGGPGWQEDFSNLWAATSPQVAKARQGEEGVDGRMGDPWRGHELYALQGLDSFARTLGEVAVSAGVQGWGMWVPACNASLRCGRGADWGCAGVRAACARGELGNRFDIVLLGEEANEQEQAPMWAKLCNYL